MSDQGQFGVDEQALRNAIGKLEDLRDRADSLVVSLSATLGTGELSALDYTTGRARSLFQDRIGGVESSASQISQKLDEKINAYRAALDEYARAEDNSTVDAQRLEKES